MPFFKTKGMRHENPLLQQCIVFTYLPSLLMEPLDRPREAIIYLPVIGLKYYGFLERIIPGMVAGLFVFHNIAVYHIYVFISFHVSFLFIHLYICSDDAGTGEKQ